MKSNENCVLSSINTTAKGLNTSKEKFKIMDELLDDPYYKPTKEFARLSVDYIREKINVIDMNNYKIRQALDLLDDYVCEKIGYSSIEEFVENKFNSRCFLILNEDIELGKLEKKLLMFDDPMGTIDYWTLKLLLNLKDEKLILEVWNYAMERYSLYDYGNDSPYPGAYFINMAIDELVHSKTKSTWNDGTAEIIAELIVPSVVEEMSRYVPGKTEKRIKAVLNSLELQLIEQRDKL